MKKGLPIESLKFGLANLDSRVCQPGFVRIRDLQILIFKDSFCAIELRICEKRPNLWKFRSQIESMIRIFKDQTCKSVKSDLSITKWNKPFWSQDSWPWYKMNPWIRKQIHRYTIPWYDSRNLSKYSSNWFLFWLKDLLSTQLHFDQVTVLVIQLLFQAFCNYSVEWLNDFILRMRDSYTNPYETKRIESFEIFGLTKRIHETNLMKIVSRNESTKRIFWTP